MPAPFSPRLGLKLAFRRCTSGLLLAAFVVTAAGIPLPSANRLPKNGEPFPCMTSGCGCNSAEQCWRSCCCHTLAERLAWARKQGVRPPEFAIAGAKRAGADLNWLADNSKNVAVNTKNKSCCIVKSATRSCCVKCTAGVPATSERACCASRHDKVASRKVASHVVGLRALQCGGQSLNWLAAVPTLIMLRPQLSHELPLVARLRPAASDVAEGLTDDPAVPPPERA